MIRKNIDAILLTVEILRYYTKVTMLKYPWWYSFWFSLCFSSRPKARCNVCWHWWYGHSEAGSPRSCRAATHTLWALQTGQTFARNVTFLHGFFFLKDFLTITVRKILWIYSERCSNSTSFPFSDWHWPTQGCPYVRTSRLWQNHVGQGCGTPHYR